MFTAITSISLFYIDVVIIKAKNEGCFGFAVTAGLCAKP